VGLLKVVLTVFDQGVFHLHRINKCFPLGGIGGIRNKQLCKFSCCPGFHKLMMEIEAFAIVFGLSKMTDEFLMAFVI